jgi:hypothetical protein
LETWKTCAQRTTTDDHPTMNTTSWPTQAPVASLKGESRRFWATALTWLLDLFTASSIRDVEPGCLCCGDFDECLRALHAVLRFRLATAHDAIHRHASLRKPAQSEFPWTHLPAMLRPKRARVQTAPGALPVKAPCPHYALHSGTHPRRSLRGQ